MNIKMTRATKWSAGAAVLLIVVCGSTYAMQDSQKNEVEVDDLLAEFKQVMKGRREFMAARYHDSHIEYTELLAAENELLEAELSIVVNRDERVAVLEKLLQNCVFLEKHIAAQVDVGQATGAELLGAKMGRLLAAIQLKRAQQ